MEIKRDNSQIKRDYLWVLLRLGLGWIFLWAFVDKLFGLGFSTAGDKSWLAGNSPTYGFLSSVAHGPFSSFYQIIAGNTFIDWLFMIGLFLIGLSLILGIFLRAAGYSGALMMFLMWTALLPPANNPLIDDHIIYILVLLGIAIINPKQFGLGDLLKNLNLTDR